MEPRQSGHRAQRPKLVPIGLGLRGNVRNADRRIGLARDEEPIPTSRKCLGGAGRPCRCRQPAVLRSLARAGIDPARPPDPQCTPGFPAGAGRDGQAVCLTWGRWASPVLAEPSLNLNHPRRAPPSCPVGAGIDRTFKQSTGRSRSAPRAQGWASRCHTYGARQGPCPCAPALTCTAVPIVKDVRWPPGAGIDPTSRPSGRRSRQYPDRGDGTLLMNPAQQYDAGLTARFNCR